MVALASKGKETNVLIDNMLQIQMNSAGTVLKIFKKNMARKKTI
jgi:hypothetical protein